MTYRDKSRLAIFTTIALLLLSLSLSLFQKQNISWQPDDNSMGFNNPILLFTNAISINSLGLLKRENEQLNFSNSKKLYLQRFQYSSKVNNHDYFILSQQKLLNIFQKYQLEGG